MGLCGEALPQGGIKGQYWGVTLVSKMPTGNEN